MIAYITPVQFLFSDARNNRIYVKREDLLPVSFGGNKARIARVFIDDMRSNGKNCMIGYGNARSNLSRVLSDMCSMEGIPCHIVSPSDDDGKRKETFNSLLSKKCGVIFHECLKTDVASAVGKVISQCREDGLDPYYINGDIYGKGNEAVPVAAYRDVYNEISEQSASMNVGFDRIFLPTGTGMTQSGLLSGKALKKGNEKIIGISVARSSGTETSIIENYIRAYETANGFDHLGHEIMVEDSYLCGGYGKYGSQIEETIDLMYAKYGIYLDPTYTGKAFYGMTDYLKKNGISDENILFIHTGGAPLFFDYLTRKEGSLFSEPELCDDYVLVYDFLCGIDDSLPAKLSERVDLPEFANKVLKNGRVIAVKNDGKIISASLFYCNDMETRSAFITMIGTLRPFRKSGVGADVIKACENYAKNAGMKYMRLETDIANNREIIFYLKNGYSIEYVEKKIHMVKEL